MILSALLRSSEIHRQERQTWHRLSASAVDRTNLFRVPGGCLADQMPPPGQIQRVPRDRFQLEESIPSARECQIDPPASRQAKVTESDQRSSRIGGLDKKPCAPGSMSVPECRRCKLRSVPGCRAGPSWKRVMAEAGAPWLESNDSTRTVQISKANYVEVTSRCATPAFSLL